MSKAHQLRVTHYGTSMILPLCVVSEVCLFYYLLIKAERASSFSWSWSHLRSVLPCTNHYCHWQCSPAASSAPPSHLPPTPATFTEPSFPSALIAPWSSSTAVTHGAHAFLTLPAQCSLQNASHSVNSGEEGKNAFLLVPQLENTGTMLLVSKHLSECILIFPFLLILFSYKQPILLIPQGLRDPQEKTKQTSR